MLSSTKGVRFSHINEGICTNTTSKLTAHGSFYTQWWSSQQIS